MRILGIHTSGHDTGACLFEDGRLVYSIETERLSRVKHDHRSLRALRHLFDRVGLTIDDIDLVAVGLNLRQDLVQVEGWPRKLEVITPRQLHVETHVGLFGGRTPAVVVGHEVCHAALAVHYAATRERCLVMTNEGRGTFGRNSFFLAEDGVLNHLESDFMPWYGTGFGWAALGYALGFGKSPTVAGTLMGLAGHGEVTDAARQLLLGVPRDLHTFERERQEEVMADFLGTSGLVDTFEGKATIMATFQELFSTSVLDALRRRLGDGEFDRVALAGGCALNVTCNSLVRAAFDPRLAVPPAPNDAGIALGAAVYAQDFLLGEPAKPFSVYANGAEETAEEVRAGFEKFGLEARDVDLEEVAGALAEGKVVAWLEGRAEVGPRALGHRSLLGNAGHPGIKKKLSETIKHRQWFRPLAPVMREERFAELLPGEGTSPHMLYAYPAAGLGIDEGVHVDGSARIQTLASADHPRLHALLERFEALSGVPALVNTSLNQRGRAIAQTTEHCLDDFAESEVDLVVSGPLMAELRRA